ncbi:hypothetical protein F5887DRAFT_926468 [Amanita rubescens]|nr:hypothetical protein F5887DRAFT_926468 [Amanita rubescens]
MLFSNRFIVVIAALLCAVLDKAQGRLYIKRSNLNGELNLYPRLAYRSQLSVPPLTRRGSSQQLDEPPSHQFDPNTHDWRAQESEGDANNRKTPPPSPLHPSSDSGGDHFFSWKEYDENSKLPPLTTNPVPQIKAPTGDYGSSSREIGYKKRKSQGNKPYAVSKPSN